MAPGPVIYYPVVRQVAVAKKLDVLDSARLMALVAVARSDAFVAIFDAKYHYDFWRPITAIRNGDIDDNPATERDATWLPIADTPMHPEYPCAHCIMASTIASVVESLFGTADLPELSLTSPTAPGVTHRWTNLKALVDEVSQARIWAGFHYRFSTRVGEDMGRKIGDYTVKTVMQPTTPCGCPVILRLGSRLRGPSLLQVGVGADMVLGMSVPGHASPMDTLFGIREPTTPAVGRSPAQSLAQSGWRYEIVPMQRPLTVNFRCGRAEGGKNSPSSFLASA